VAGSGNHQLALEIQVRGKTGSGQMQISTRYLLIPVALQMLCMTLDEFYFHWQRELPRWERLGHPLDTLTVLGCYVWLLIVPPGAVGAQCLCGAMRVFVPVCNKR
jgi:hypothetical protein